MVPVSVEIDQEIDEGRCIGQAGRNGGAGHFISGRKDHKHEQRVQNDIEDAALTR